MSWSKRKKKDPRPPAEGSSKTRIYPGHTFKRKKKNIATNCFGSVQFPTIRECGMAQIAEKSAQINGSATGKSIHGARSPLACPLCSLADRLLRFVTKPKTRQSSELEDPRWSKSLTESAQSRGRAKRREKKMHIYIYI